MPFLLSHFSPGDKIENCPAQFLAVCWIVHVEFKVHRLRDGFSVSNALVLKGSCLFTSEILTVFYKARLSNVPGNQNGIRLRIFLHGTTCASCNDLEIKSDLTLARKLLI